MPLIKASRKQACVISKCWFSTLTASFSLRLTLLLDILAPKKSPVAKAPAAMSCLGCRDSISSSETWPQSTKLYFRLQSQS